MDNNNDTKFITLQVSAPIFWGFQYKVPLDYALSVTVDSLAAEVKTYMKNFFELHNLQELKDMVNKLNFCIHQQINSADNIVYICDHSSC